MTDQSPNNIFKASSFLQSHNAEYIEQIYAADQADAFPQPLAFTTTFTVVLDRGGV